MILKQLFPFSLDILFNLLVPRKISRAFCLSVDDVHLNLLRHQMAGGQWFLQ
mgnify:CR=1 FL=1